MNSDIRLSVGFFDHPKTVKLERQLGHEGIGDTAQADTEVTYDAS